MCLFEKNVVAIVNWIFWGLCCTYRCLFTDIKPFFTFVKMVISNKYCTKDQTLYPIPNQTNPKWSRIYLNSNAIGNPFKQSKFGYFLQHAHVSAHGHTHGHYNIQIIFLYFHLIRIISSEEMPERLCTKRKQEFNLLNDEEILEHIQHYQAL